MKVSPNPALRTVVNDDGAVILDIEHDSISMLNPTGAYVWRGLARGDMLETIIANLALDTGEDSSMVERDVLEFIDDLKKRRLLPH